MNAYEKEMRLMFGDNDIIKEAKFVGRTVLGKIDDDLRVKLQMNSTAVSGKYDAIQISIINRSEGVIDKQNFRFSDIIGKLHRPGLSDIDPHMWDCNGKGEWYIPISMDQKAKIADTILGYVGMYQSQTSAQSARSSMTMSM